MTVELERVPITGRSGVVAYAIVDGDAFLFASRYRWHLSRNGYAVRGKGTYMHRELMGLKVGDPWNVDHINRNKLDNRYSNLRLVKGQLQNLRNHSGRGYNWRRGKWQVELTFNYKHIYGGRFENEEDAKIRVAELRHELYQLAYRRGTEQAPRD